MILCQRITPISFRQKRAGRRRLLRVLTETFPISCLRLLQSVQGRVPQRSRQLFLISESSLILFRNLNRPSSQSRESFQKTSDIISKATSNPEDSALGTNPNLNTAKFLPSEIIRHLPLGVGAAISAIQDHPEIAKGCQLLRMPLKEVPGAVVDTARGFAKSALSYALTFYGIGSKYLNPLLHLGVAPGTDESGAFNVNVPGLGNVQISSGARPERLC